LLITESADEFDALRNAFDQEIKPRGIIEQMYVHDISSLVWEILRLRRCKVVIINSAFRTQTRAQSRQPWPLGESGCRRREVKMPSRENAGPEFSAGEVSQRLEGTRMSDIVGAGKCGDRTSDASLWIDRIRCNERKICP
jgi:hypothetical protein